MYNDLIKELEEIKYNTNINTIVNKCNKYNFDYTTIFYMNDILDYDECFQFVKNHSQDFYEVVNCVNSIQDFSDDYFKIDGYGHLDYIEGADLEDIIDKIIEECRAYE